MGILDADHQLTRSDMQLIERGMKRWFTDDLKAKAIQKLDEALESEDERIKIRAVKIVTDMEAQNQKDEHKVVDVELSARNAELDALAADLGIATDLIVDGTAESSSGDSSDEGDTAGE